MKITHKTPIMDAQNTFEHIQFPQSPQPRQSYSFSRRLIMSVLSSCLLLGALSACNQASSDKTVVALDINPHTTCDLDGMLLGDYPGPKGQIFYAGQEKPVFFCDTVELFHTVLAPEQIKAIQQIYVQDMAKADWENPSSHWIDAKTGFYVLGSKRHGSMGPTVASFSKEADAQQFIKEWGGKLYRFADMKIDMVDLSGGALHDTRM